jgi:hypothetical protein
MVTWISSIQRTHNTVVTIKSHLSGTFRLVLVNWYSCVFVRGKRIAVIFLKILDISVQNTVTQVNRCLEFCLPLLYWIMHIRILTLKTTFFVTTTLCCVYEIHVHISGIYFKSVVFSAYVSQLVWLWILHITTCPYIFQNQKKLYRV